MNLDQQRMYGITDWRLPSPSSTPKSATFSESLCYTPRTDAFQSHFFDAWSTPRANAQQTPTRTPLLPRSGTIERPLSCNTQSQPIENPGFHVHHYSSTPNLPLPPVDPSRRLASSPGPLVSPTDTRSTAEASNLFSASGNEAMGAPQIQTPPPTRDPSSTRTRTFDVRNFPFNTPSALFPRRDSAPATSTTAFGQRPGPPLFPNLQLSLETHRHGNAVPTRAPIPPQPRFIWNQNSSAEIASFGASASEDPFGFTPSHGQNLFNFQQSATTSDANRIDSSSLDVSGDSWTAPALPMTTSAELQKVTGGAASTSCLDDPFVTTTTGVDPNMLFSFAGDSLFSSPFPPQPVTNPGQRQPYEQQNLEAEREKRLAQGKGSEQFFESSNPLSAMATAKPGLQRSNSHSGLVGRSASADGRRLLLNEPPRRNSPLKRGNQTSLTAISEHAATRPKTRLVIDQHGNARTETIRGEGSPRRSVDHRTRYSGLWEDDSDSDRGNDHQNPSQHKTLQGTPMSRRNSGKSRVGSFLSRSQTTKTLRSSSIGSFTGELSRRLGRLSTETTPIKLGSFEDLRRDGMSQGNGLGENTRKDGKFLPEGRNSEDDDAQDALKRMLEETKMKRQDSVNSRAQTLEAHNERWKASADMCRTDRSTGPLFDPFSDDFSLTPTSATASGSSTIFSPTTDFSGTSDSGTRCVCNSTEWDGQLMVQCESCNKWQHARCMGLPLQAESLPSVYICVFCTGNTPVVRGGHGRDPFRLGQGQQSPLSHKSTLRPRIGLRGRGTHDGF
ncbi:hypothetical protein IWX90DRAFT_25075 [Phyllosticta citrichinensis]|uniref:PHD-type domain-containing protein n=1 Tax=Phyllosticta citrichinensis TaxID=1130410 RepID=A0ABR1Y7U5_9PEZI